MLQCPAAAEERQDETDDYGSIRNITEKKFLKYFCSVSIRFHPFGPAVFLSACHAVLSRHSAKHGCGSAIGAKAEAPLPPKNLFVFFVYFVVSKWKRHFIFHNSSFTPICISRFRVINYRCLFIGATSPRLIHNRYISRKCS